MHVRMAERVGAVCRAHAACMHVRMAEGVGAVCRKRAHVCMQAPRTPSCLHMYDAGTPLM